MNRAVRQQIILPVARSERVLLPRAECQRLRDGDVAACRSGEDARSVVLAAVLVWRREGAQADEGVLGHDGPAEGIAVCAEVEAWIEDELAIFCAPTHPLAKLASVSIDKLLTANWILREQGSGTRETFDQALRHHLPDLKIRMELEHTEAIKRAVESGLGIGCISRLAVRDGFKRGSLVEIKMPMLDLRRQFMFVWHKNRYQTPAMIAFLDYCRTLTNKLKRSDEIQLTASDAPAV